MIQFLVQVTLTYKWYQSEIDIQRIRGALRLKKELVEMPMVRDLSAPAYEVEVVEVEEDVA